MRKGRKIFIGIALLLAVGFYLWRSKMTPIQKIMYDAKDARTTWGKNIQQWALESGQRYDDGFIQSVTQDKINKGNADVFGNYLKRRWWFSWQKVY